MWTCILKALLYNALLLSVMPFLNTYSVVIVVYFNTLFKYYLTLHDCISCFMSWSRNVLSSTLAKIANLFCYFGNIITWLNLLKFTTLLLKLNWNWNLFNYWNINRIWSYLCCWTIFIFLIYLACCIFCVYCIFVCVFYSIEWNKDIHSKFW